MKRITFVFCALFFFSMTPGWAEPRMGGGESMGNNGGGSFSGNSDFHVSHSVSPSFRSMGIQGVPHYSNRSQLFSTSTRPSMRAPAYGPRGGSFRASVISHRGMSSSFVRNNMAVVSSRGFRNRVASLNFHENSVGHYYWHAYGGLNYCHYYDRWGCNWYGWDCGAGFYWSCWYGNYWWWYDPAYYRWCYWYDGWWWWQNPNDVTVTYVYNNGQYIPEQSSSSSSAQQQTTNDNYSQSSEAPAPESSYSSVPPDEETSAAAPVPIALKTVRSKDGSRTVKLAGVSNDAFLYDTTGTPAFQSKYLASDVTSVRFLKGSDGALQINLSMKDGSTELFDKDGNSISN